MGNQSSREEKHAAEPLIEPSSSMEKEVNLGLDRRRHPMELLSCPSSPPRLSLDQEMLRSSLRKRGLLVGEGDLKDALAKHTNPVEALSYLLDSGRTRQAATVQRGPDAARIAKAHRTNGHPQFSDAALSIVKSAQKRAREDSESPRGAEAESTEPPMKRPVNVEDSVFSRVLKESGLGEMSEGGFGFQSLSTPRDKDPGRGREASETKERALITVRPGLPSEAPFDGSQHNQGPDQSSPPTAAAAAAAPEADKTRERERTLVTLPKTLRIGDVKQTMLSAVERWVTKTLEEKDEAVRAVKNSLCLPEVGPQFKERLDRQISRGIDAGLNDLCNAPDVKAGATLMGNIIQATRSEIHENIFEIGERYSALFVKGGSKDGEASAVANNDKQRFPTKSFFHPPRFVQPSPRSPILSFASPFVKPSSSEDSRNPRPLDSRDSRELWSPFNPKTIFYIGGPASNPRVQPRSVHPSSSHACAGVTARRFEAPALTSTPARGATRSPEEEVYWIASNVCKESLRKAELARAEAEWLERQVDVVHEAAVSIKDDLEKQSQRQQEKLKKLEDDMQKASGEVEEVTRGLIDKHVASSLTKEDAILSFLSTLNGEKEEGHQKVRARAQAIALHQAATSSHRQQSAALQLTTQAIKISGIMSHHLFGDLLDTLSAFQLRANERRMSCQSDLKSTASHMLEKLKVAARFLMHRKRVAAKRREARIQSAMEDSTLFGEVTANGVANQTLIKEMETFMEQSIQKAKEIKADSDDLWCKMKGNIPREDLLSITEDVKQLFSNEAESAGSEIVQGSPNRSFGLASSHGNGQGSFSEDED